MADSKISALPASTTPLAGTEVLPIVQSSTTKQVSVANLTAGRALSAASLTLTTTPLPVASGGSGLAVGAPVFSAYQTTLQTLSNVTWEKINFQTAEFDTSSGYNTSTSTYVAPISGYYQVSAGVQLQTTPVVFVLAIYVQGSAAKQIAYLVNSAGAATSGSGLVYLTAGWTLNIYALVTGTPATTTGQTVTWFSACYVRGV